MKGLAGGETIDELNAANFDQAIALQWIKSGRFGVENDLAHLSLPECESAVTLRHFSHALQNVCNLRLGVLEVL